MRVLRDALFINTEMQTRTDKGIDRLLTRYLNYLNASEDGDAGSLAELFAADRALRLDQLAAPAELLIRKYKLLMAAFHAGLTRGLLGVERIPVA